MTRPAALAFACLVASLAVLGAVDVSTLWTLSFLPLVVSR